MADQPQSRLERATDSTLAKAAARILLPSLVSLLGSILVYLALDTRGELSGQGKDIAALKSDVRDINTRLDAGVLRQVETNTRHYEDLDKRMWRVEQKVGITPP